MVKRLKFLVILVAVALFGIMSVNAKAAKIWGVCHTGTVPEVLSPVTSANPNFYYKVAYEVYSNTAGASSRVSDVIIQRETSVLHKADSINLILDGAKFTPDQSVYYALLVDDNASHSISTSLGIMNNLVGNDVTENHYLAAITSTTISQPTANIGLRVVDNETTANHNPYLFLAQVVVDNASANPVTYKVIKIGSAVYVNPNLDASCSNEPNIIINATMPNEKVDNQLFAKIMPLCGPYTVGAGLQKLTAKLNTDADFKFFSSGDAVFDNVTIDTCNGNCASSSCSFCNGNCAGGGDNNNKCNDWIVGYEYVCPATVNVSFTLTSQVEEPGIKTISYGPIDVAATQVACTTTDHKTWNCSAKNIPLQAATDGCLEIKVDGTTSLVPTTWTISDVTATVPGAATICPLNIVDGTAGAWYGGLEAIVPFLKSGNGYETYMKLYNRYSKDADVYAATFDKSGAMLVALTKIGTIPSAGYKQWTAAEIGNDLGLTAAQMANGFPVKLVIRVPDGKGCISGTSVDNSEHLCYHNTNDPYVEGIVVSVTPNGQRSIPLEFKYFKNGAYNQ